MVALALKRSTVATATKRCSASTNFTSAESCVLAWRTMAVPRCTICVGQSSLSGKSTVATSVCAVPSILVKYTEELIGAENQRRFADPDIDRRGRCTK